MIFLNKLHRSIVMVMLLICSLLIFLQSALADEMITVNIDNFVRAKTAEQIDLAL